MTLRATFLTAATALMTLSATCAYAGDSSNDFGGPQYGTWNDGGAGGSFAPSASVQNPSYTAAANVTGSDRLVTLTRTK